MLKVELRDTRVSETDPDEAPVSTSSEFLKIISTLPLETDQLHISFQFSAESIAQIRYVFKRGDICLDSEFSEWEDFRAHLQFTHSSPGEMIFCIEGRQTATSKTSVLIEHRWVYAPKPDQKPIHLTNLSIDHPLLTLVNDENDCRSKISDSGVNSRRESTAIIDGKINLLITCSGSRWSITRATWDGKSPTANWVDADPDTPETYDIYITRGSLLPDGTTRAGNPYSLHLVQLADKTLTGIYTGSGGGTTPLPRGSHPIRANSADEISATGLKNMNNWWFNPIAGSWRTSHNYSEIWLDIDEDDEIGIYFSSKDPDGVNYLGYASASANEFTTNINHTDTYLAVNYLNPMVRHINQTWHLIAYHNMRKQWEYIMGDSRTGFDWDHYQALDFADIFEVNDKWFTDNYEREPNTKAPRLVGFEILEYEGSYRGYLFYRAGNLADRTATEIRGIGVLSTDL